MGLQRVGKDWVTNTFTSNFIDTIFLLILNWKKKNKDQSEKLNISLGHMSGRRAGIQI